MKVEVTTPDEYQGSVIGDLSSRRGMIQGSETDPNGEVINLGYGKTISILDTAKLIMKILGREQEIFVDDKRVRPVIDFHDRVNTSFSLIINSLEFFKQPEEKIKFNVELDLYWKDQLLVWNPEDFGNVTDLNVNPNEIWTPDIELYNSGDYPEIWTRNSEATLDNFLLKERKLSLSSRA